MSKKLKPVGAVKGTDGAVKSGANTSASADDDALRAVEQQLAAEDGLDLSGGKSDGKSDKKSDGKKDADKSDKSDKKSSDTDKNKDDKPKENPEDNPAVKDSGPAMDASVASKPASEMSKEELRAAKEALKKRETTIGTKTSQDGKIKYKNKDGKRLDEVAKGKTKTVDALGGKITGVDGGTVKYEGELGKFEYDTDEWALGTKIVKDECSGVETTIPVLRYICEDNGGWGDHVYGGNIDIPKGLKSLDYSFENNKALETIPYIPDSVQSAHAAFKGCKKAERAADNAKDGEHEGGWDIAGWAGGGAAGGALGGAGIGACFGGVGAGPGAGIGAAVGAVGGVTKGIYEYCTKDGKGGKWSMPSGLKDASEMFSGCESLTEAYDSAGKNLVNARGMYAGTKKLGTDKVAKKFGSVAITDFNSDSKLSKEAVQGSYSGTNVELTKDLKGNYSKDWDEATGTLNKKGISQEEKQEVEKLNQTLKEHDAVFGEENTDMTAQTDGLASYGTVKTENGYQSTTDVNAKNVEESELEGGNLLDRGIVSIGEFWILKKVTGNSLIAGVATFGLQAVGILPKSMKPVLNAVTGFVGKDSAVGKALSGIADKLPDGKKDDRSASEKLKNGVEDAKDKKEKDSSDKTNSTVDERVKSDMNAMQTISSKNASGAVDISHQMAENGKSVVKDGVFLTAANKAANDAEFEDVRTMSMTMAAGLEEKAQSMAGESGKLSDEDKETLASQCMNVMNGLNAYDDGALSQIKSQYGSNNAKSEQATNGLSKVMYVSATPFVDAVKEMDEKYGFLSKDDKQKLSSMELTGVAGYDEYQVGDMEKQAAASFEQQKAEQSAKQDAVQPEKLDDGFGTKSLDDDMSMYANAGLNDEIHPVKPKSLSHAAMPLQVVAKAGPVSSRSVESRTGERAAKPAVAGSVSRGEQAERVLGNIEKKDTEAGYDYEKNW